MDKYLLVKTPKGKTPCFECKKPCETRDEQGCPPGEHYIFNLAWRPISQRVRELILNTGDGIYVSPDAVKALANELEREEGNEHR